MSKFFESLDWSSWLYGLLAGGIGGGATAVYGAFAASMIDNHFAVGSANSFKLMGLMFAMSFLKDAALFLKQNPLPPVKHTEATQTITQPGKAPITIKTKVEETRSQGTVEPQ